MTLVVPLRPVPIATPNVGTAGTNNEHELARTVAPLDLYLCGDCGHLQILDVVDPAVQYRNYLYRTAISVGLVEHFGALAADVMARQRPVSGSLVVEIGSNDGSLLRFFKDAGMNVLGIDPARAIAAQATSAGIETLPEFFTADLAERIVRERGKAKVILANNVMANIDDLSDVMAGLRILLDFDGVFVFETQWGADVIRHNLVDTIYHEHLSYFMVRSLVAFFAAGGMALIDVRRIPAKGGSLRCIVQLTGGPRPVESSVAECLASEVADGMFDLATYRSFTRRLEDIRTELSNLIAGIRATGGTIAGYGASVGTTTLLHQFCLWDSIDFLVDDHPFKDVLIGPGYRLPVLSADALYQRRPAAVVVFAWRYADSIIARHSRYREAGGKFIVTLPLISVK
jgi:hypothetical protein